MACVKRSWLLSRTGSGPAGLNDGAYDAAVHPQRRAVHAGRQAARHEHDERRDLLRVEEALEDRRRAGVIEEFLLVDFERLVLLRRECLDERAHALTPGRTGQDGVDGHGRAPRHLGEASGDSQLRRLRRAVVDHLRGNLERALARNEHDAAPVAREHAGQIRTRQAYAAEDVHLEEAEPVTIGEGAERFRRAEAGAVDEYVHFWAGLDELRTPLGA